VFLQETEIEDLLATLQEGDRLVVRGALNGPQVVVAREARQNAPLDELPSCAAPQSDCGEGPGPEMPEPEVPGEAGSP